MKKRNIRIIGTLACIVFFLVLAAGSFDSDTSSDNDNLPQDYDEKVEEPKQEEVPESEVLPPEEPVVMTNSSEEENASDDEEELVIITNSSEDEDL